ncbi:MAG: HAD superfamily hydrolase (TIGR01490 family) [Halieaceae bacterium]|jgi:HAD superfamily hydrolase (TIGR01490 family)
MTLAIFDLDNTLIAGDSDHLWGEFLCRRGVVDELTFRADNDAFNADYQRGELDINAYLRFALAPLKGRSAQELRSWQSDFMREFIEPIMLPAAQELIASHRQRGHRPLIITATNEFVTRPIADALGVDTLLGCAVEVAMGRFTGRAHGTLSYREGKVKRLDEWLLEEGEEAQGAWFYSDSHNDLPLLNAVDNPVAVDPDEKLAAAAAAQGWPVISLRNTAGSAAR